MYRWNQKFYFPFSLCLLLGLNACSSALKPAADASGGSTTTTTVASSVQSSGNPNCPSTASAFASGSGTAGSPYVITTFCHLLSLANNTGYWANNIQLAADIDMTGITFNPMITMAGTFDGQGHTISNWSGANALFVVNAGTIQNLNVSNAIITPLGGARPAVLVGTNMTTGTINNCTVQGTVNGIVPAGLDSDNDIYWFVGGLVSINMGLVEHSSASVAVSGIEAIGGLVGQNEGGTIKTSSSSGSVSASSSGWNANSSTVTTEGAGGLVGSHATGGLILNSYATGAVNGQDLVGGLVGYIAGPIQNCYSSGAVTGTGGNVGGLVGQNAGGSATSSYWDQTTSGQAASTVGTGEVTASMEVAGTFTGWDFSGVWNTPNGAYPTLR